jgi:hypothetical protein
VAALPTTFVVSPEGRVVQKHMGVVSLQEYDREIRALLKMPVEAHIETVADVGQIFAKNATELPGVEMSNITPAQRKTVEANEFRKWLSLSRRELRDTAGERPPYL